MPYLELFEHAADHIRRQRLKVIFQRGRPIAIPAIERAAADAGFVLPPTLAEFYAEVGDGMRLAWISGGEGSPSANLELEPIADLIECLQEQPERGIEWADDYDFSGTDDPQLARATALRMRKWITFFDEGNGDRICLDAGVDPPPVVFDQHDWFDGGSGANGHVLAPTLLEFLTAWSRVCFQFPRGLWWPEVFNPDGAGVNWSSDEFDDRFRLPPIG